MIKDHTIEEKVSEFSLDYEQFLLLGEVRRASQKKFKNIKKKLISACRGELWERLLFYLRDGLRRNEGLLMAKSFLSLFDHIL